MVGQWVTTEGRYTLVLDDVYTTGTQLNAVAKCLLDEGGAARARVRAWSWYERPGSP
jgi:predicted amidophosphoribosyltransferase